MRWIDRHLRQKEENGNERRAILTMGYRLGEPERPYQLFGHGGLQWTVFQSDRPALAVAFEQPLGLLG